MSAPVAARREMLISKSALSLSLSPWPLQSPPGCPHPDQIGRSPSCCCGSGAGTPPLCHSGLRPLDSKSQKERHQCFCLGHVLPTSCSQSAWARVDTESRFYPQRLTLKLLDWMPRGHQSHAAALLFWPTSPVSLEVPHGFCRLLSSSYARHTLVTRSRDRGLRRRLFTGGFLVCPPSPMSLRPDAASEAQLGRGKEIEVFKWAVGTQNFLCLTLGPQLKPEHTCPQEKSHCQGQSVEWTRRNPERGYTS